ncbi:DUF1302 domain-containing protein [Pseudomonas sp. TH41]|uniref:DUF1302 family protein n=1 Tax=Pseudomonas sp. TH41 TaxID=2796405 RepID=UPI001913F57D|nr:DUF1302 domain-containing protein [Pseudomonas sp. TH41]
MKTIIIRKSDTGRARRWQRVGNRSLLCLLAPAIPLCADAALLELDNPDWEVRFDNTVRYNVAWRTEKQNKDFLVSPGFDDTENKFDRGDAVTNRVDLLNELDVAYQGLYGFRVSTAGWYDQAYQGSAKPNDDLIASGNYINNHYNHYATRYNSGPSGEFLDAFVFANVQLGDVGVGMKAGKHNVYWGESLFTLGNSIAYSQGPVDTIKSAASPGTEAKELFLPINQLSASISLTNELTVGLQYLLDWKPYRLVPGGTYYASSDGSRSDIASPPALLNGPDVEPDHKYGDYGVNMRWSPSGFGGTMGLYYRKFDEKLPWSFTEIQGRTPTAVRLAYARGTELWGLSLSQNIAQMSVAGELSYRKNTALVSRSGYTVRTTAAGIEPDYDAVEGARGNTWHALINSVYLLPRTALWDGGTLQGELTYTRLDSITDDPQNRFNKVGHGCTTAFTDNCATKDAWGMQMRFTPEWPQALPGWDLSMPMNLAYGLEGNSPALGGTNEGAYTWTVGIGGVYHSVHSFVLSYIDSYARYDTRPDGTVTTDYTAGPAVQNDHGRVSLTYKTTF